MPFLAFGEIVAVLLQNFLSEDGGPSRPHRCSPRMKNGSKSPRCYLQEDDLDAERLLL